MICPKCRFSQAGNPTECPRCGVVFAKFARQQSPGPTTPRPLVEADAGRAVFWHSYVLRVPEKTDILRLGGRSVLWSVFAVWGLVFIFSTVQSNAAGDSFMHLVNLPFHEAGHLFFRPFGRIIHSLGGTLGQLIMPLICLSVLLLKTRDPFGAAIALWWFGQNFIDIAPYINDARSLSLPLLGGNFGYSSPYGFHDWQFILTELHLLRYDHLLASMAHKTGTVIILAACAWGATLLYREYRVMQVE